MSSLIQCYKMTGTISAMDFNGNNRYFVAGGKQSINLMEFNTQKQYWFECKKKITKHKNATMTKVCISQLSWNKYKNQMIAMGTTSGFVFIYDVNDNNMRTSLSVKGHDGNIKNIVWYPNSANVFLSSSYQNQINIWDLRQKKSEVQKKDNFKDNDKNKFDKQIGKQTENETKQQKTDNANSANMNSNNSTKVAKQTKQTSKQLEHKITKKQYPQSIKIRDIRFNPHDSNYFAVQCSSAIKIVDFRKLEDEVLSKHIKDNQLQGYMMQWDPHQKFRLASGVSKQINILNWEGSNLRLDETLTHYSLIKSFKWLKNKRNFFGISGQNPQKNICFYDLSDKDRVSYMFAGHSRSVDCWMMNDIQNIIISASNAKQKKQSNSSNLKSSSGLIVAQYTQNYIDPNEARLQHPLSYDNNNGLIFSLSLENSQIKNFSRNSRKYRYSFPTIYHNSQQQNGKKFTNLKQELEYLHKSYIYQGRNDIIAQRNSQVALDCQKSLCFQFWKILFILAYPQENKQHTLQSIYEEKIKADIAFVQNRIILNNKSQLKRELKKFNINNLLQYLVDQNEIQTAVLAAIILQSKIPELIDEYFFQKIISPYIQILRKLELYTIASETISMTKFQKFTSNTSNYTLYKITCGWCKQSVTKGICKCNLLCVLCQQRLSQRMVIWCKYCGHGGHAKQYKDWFQKNKYCPHGCQHQCFQAQDFQ